MLQRRLKLAQTLTWSLVLALVLALVGMGSANEELLGLQADPALWAMPNGTYDSSNFSQLDAINSENVQDLQVKWTFQTGVLDSHEGTPLVIGDTMYLVTPKPNVLYALDLNRDGVIKWSYAVDMPNLEQAISAACCGAQTRGVAYANNKLFFNSLDGQLFGIDAETGEVLWRNQVANLDIAETTTTAPLIIDNHLIIGVAGGERGVRGWVAAFDQDTGEQLWKMYSTGPDEEMGIGPRFQPFYADDQVEEPGLSTWYEDSWRLGGGTVWGWWSFDPEINTFYYSTGNCAPWNPDYRRDPATAPGIFEYPNKYCAALMARDGTTGELLWAYSLTPQDQWDLDEPGPNLLLDLEIDGEMRKTLVKAARNGFFYVFDRVTGEILLEPFLHSPATWTTGEFDMETGRPVFDPERYMYTDIPVEGICPFIAARNWENDTYSPQTGLMYFTIQNRCADMMMVEGEYVPGQSYTLYQNLGSYLGPDGEGDWRAELVAYNPVTGEKAWGLPYTGTMGSWGKPLLSTAGNLLFQGSETGEFRAFDAATGEILWSFRTGTDFRNAPMSYIGPDGEQYVAVIASGAPTSMETPADAPPDEAGRFRRASATLYVFGLPND